MINNIVHAFYVSFTGMFLKVLMYMEYSLICCFGSHLYHFNFCVCMLFSFVVLFKGKEV